MRDAVAPVASTWFPRTAGGMSRLAYLEAQAAGVDPGPLLVQAGIGRHEIENPGAELGVGQQIAFMNAVAEALGDDRLGFRLACACELRSIGLYFYVLASSNTLIDALQRGARYTSIVNEGIAQTCVDGTLVGMSYGYVGVSRHADRHQIEFWVTALLRVCRQLTGRRLVPARVRFVHRRPACREMDEYFGGAIAFGADDDSLTFPAAVRDLPVVTADCYLNELLVSYCDEAIAHRRTQGSSFRASVENAVAPLLPHGRARAGDVARHLGVSQRTLARRLSQEGFTFSALVDGLRCDLATRYLAEPELSISQVAWLLGYREVASFTHACRRWTGRTPRQMRASLMPARLISGEPA